MNPELEAAEEQIKNLKRSVRSLEEQLEHQIDTLNDQAAVISQLRMSLAEAEVQAGFNRVLYDQSAVWDREREDLEGEIRILKETVITLATKGSQAPAAPSTPHTANSTLNMLSQMISSEAAAQEWEWRG